MTTQMESSEDTNMPTPFSLLTALRAFTTSPRTFQILHTVGATLPPASPNPSTLYILDSSFNPPTFAHQRISSSALLSDARRKPGPSRLLLLLATQNADKPAKPAAFEQRLGMMSVMAQDIRSQTEEATRGGKDVPVDIGVVKTPLFVDKVRAVEESGVYGSNDGEDGGGAGPQQVHLVGFDTLLRLLEPKYYPDHTLKPLEGLFGKHRIRVTRRTDDNWGGGDEQERFLQGLREGKVGGKKVEGWRKEWAERVELVEGRGEGEEVVSSTEVREAVEMGEEEVVGKLVTDGVREWIQRERLYKESE